MPRFSIEPGRAIVGPAGLTLYTVGTVKPVRVDAGSGDAVDGSETLVRTYVSIDGGMSDNIRPALYGADYHAELANRLSDAAPALSRVVGKHCESGDIVVHDVLLPGTSGPVTCWPSRRPGPTGARWPRTTTTCPGPGRGGGGGGTRVLVRRETEDDLLALDQG
ncbi:hypothetical protein NKG05_21695 [Oerskovia sp. M15]